MKKWKILSVLLFFVICLTACTPRDVQVSTSMDNISNTSNNSSSSATSEGQQGQNNMQKENSSSDSNTSAGSAITSDSSSNSLTSSSGGTTANGSGSANTSTSNNSSGSSNTTSTSTSNTTSNSASTSTSNSKPTNTVSPTNEIRAVWISYLDFNTLLKYKTQTQFTTNINNAFKKISAAGFNTVILQVRPYGDALYDSDVFPWSYTITGTEGKDPGFDPLQIMISQAAVYNLRVEAWVNPYRIRAATTNAALSADNPATEYIEKNNGAVIKYGGGIYYNPASSIARQTIIDGVKELVQNYNISAIHFDDYFYPTTDTAFDETYYNQYKASGGTLSLADWRRENVNILIRDVYSAIKSIDSSVQFGISPQGNMSNNYNQQYIDVEKWLSNSGYVDYICPQIYYGFNNSTYPFASTVTQWNNMIKTSGVKLYIGIAAYKVGLEDTWAGSGKTEWVSTTDILARMVSTSREAAKYGGFAIYRYDSLFNPDSAVQNQVKTELANLINILS